RSSSACGPRASSWRRSRAGGSRPPGSTSRPGEAGHHRRAVACAGRPSRARGPGALPRGAGRAGGGVPARGAVSRGAARRTKLQLLVRQEGDQGFEVRQVSSALAWLQLRPQRVEPAAYEVAEVPSRVAGRITVVLRSRLTDRYLHLPEPEPVRREPM